jgi:hypothetical protein
MELGLGSLVILALDVWAILQIVGSGIEDIKKADWIVVIIALPLLGLIIWYFAGPKKSRVATSLQG